MVFNPKSLGPIFYMAFGAIVIGYLAIISPQSLRWLWGNDWIKSFAQPMSWTFIGLMVIVLFRFWKLEHRERQGIRYVWAGMSLGLLGLLFMLVPVAAELGSDTRWLPPSIVWEDPER
jgi:hypothetical protein